MSRIALIDYGAGNLRSVANALHALGQTPTVVSAAAELAGATHMVLPGVGSFGDCMNQLERRGLCEAIRDWIREGKPYLGICLGYQLLFEASEESPGVAGLGVFAGTVRRFQAVPGLKIPHMGWNAAVPTQPESPRWAGLGASPYFYYVHSYFPVPQDDTLVAARTTYGEDVFAAAIETPTLLACQFHPEKSQDAGLALLGRFLK